MKKVRIVDILFILIFTVGFLVLNYPGISNIWNQYRQSLLISDYQKKVDQTDKATLERMWKAARQYNDTFAENGSLSFTDAFSGESGEQTEENTLYNKMLNLSNDGVMGSIEIPKINVYLSIKHGLSEEVLQDSVGHMPGTSLPVGGETSHCILAAHRGLPSAELFTDMDKVKVGDDFYIRTLNHTLKYRVIQIDIVLPADVSKLSLEKGKDYVTLVTCTPYGVNSHRMLVRGVNVPYDEKEETIDSSPMKSLRDWILQEKTLMGSIILVLLLIIGTIVKAIFGKKQPPKKKKKKGKKGKKKGKKKKKKTSSTQNNTTKKTDTKTEQNTEP